MGVSIQCVGLYGCVYIVYPLVDMCLYTVFIRMCVSIQCVGLYVCVYIMYPLLDMCLCPKSPPVHESIHTN